MIKAKRSPKEERAKGNSFQNFEIPPKKKKNSKIQKFKKFKIRFTYAMIAGLWMTDFVGPSPKSPL